MGPVRTRLIIALGALLAVGVAVPVVAQSGGGELTDGATATRQAVPASPLAGDVVSVYNSGPLRNEVMTGALGAARQAGGTAVVGRSASVGLRAVRRGALVVQAPPVGFSFPMGTTVLPPEMVGRAMGRDVSARLSSSSIVMGSTSAGLRGARAGDTVDLVASWGSTVRFTIGAVVDDSRVGGTEVLMTPEAADRLGISRLSRVVIWDFRSRAAIDDALRANGLVSTSIRIRRSWDPPDPDSTIGMARTKQLLGEFAYRVNSNGSVSQDAGWQQANLPGGRLSLGLGVRARCHNRVEPALRAALADVAAAGLSWTIDVANSNRYGGCHFPRFNRLTPNSSVGFLSRHSWGMAFDTNTVGSCQGCVPDFARRPGACRTIEIFRRHGFAWGGNFLTPDGMHFEWVGERRDLLPYPSRFCPNTSSALALAPPEEAGLDTFFADDGLYVDHHHGGDQAHTGDHGHAHDGSHDH